MMVQVLYHSCTTSCCFHDAIRDGWPLQSHLELRIVAGLLCVCLFVFVCFLFVCLLLLLVSFSKLHGESDDNVKNLKHSDTTFSNGSLAAALRAAGAVCHAIDEVVQKRHRNAFCAVR